MGTTACHPDHLTHTHAHAPTIARGREKKKRKNVLFVWTTSRQWNAFCHLFAFTSIFSFWSFFLVCCLCEYNFCTRTHNRSHTPSHTPSDVYFHSYSCAVIAADCHRRCVIEFCGVNVFVSLVPATATHGPSSRRGRLFLPFLISYFSRWVL